MYDRLCRDYEGELLPVIQMCPVSPLLVPAGALKDVAFSSCEGFRVWGWGVQGLIFRA